jgi:hypothetical protein
MEYIPEEKTRCGIHQDMVGKCRRKYGNQGREGKKYRHERKGSPAVTDPAVVPGRGRFQYIGQYRSCCQEENTQRPGILHRTREGTENNLVAYKRSSANEQVPVPVHPVGMAGPGT